MDKDIKQKWLEALRSGEYKQAREELRSIDPGSDTQSFCCLGVLCDIHAKETGGEWDRGEYRGNAEFLPHEVCAWAGLSVSNPTVAGAKLSEWNDLEKASFDQIANLIEKNL